MNRDARHSPVLLLVAPVLVAIVAIAGALTSSRGRRAPLRGTDAERGRAEVVAVRALASAGLFDAFGDYYEYTDAASFDEAGWRLGFRRLLCGRFGHVETCHPVNGAEGEDYEDAWLTVALGHGTWRVTSVEGSFDEPARAHLARFALADRRETPHWEFPAVTVGDGGTHEDPSATYRAAELWVGPIPYTGPGSACKLRGYLDGRRIFTSERPWYRRAPSPTQGCTGGLIGGGFVGVVHVDRGEIVCTPYEGRGWQSVGEPSVDAVVGQPEVLVGADLVWKGEPVELGESWCTVTAYGADGSEVARGSTASGPIWPPRLLDQRRIAMSKTFRLRTDSAELGAEAVSATVDCVLN
jgi:hypothetical protein